VAALDKDGHRMVSIGVDKTTDEKNQSYFRNVWKLSAGEPCGRLKGTA
jgi:hypothetical protein